MIVPSEKLISVSYTVIQICLYKLFVWCKFIIVFNILDGEE